MSVLVHERLGYAGQDTLYTLYYCALTINVGISGVNHSSTLTMLAATRQQLAVLARLKHDPSRDKTLI